MITVSVKIDRPVDTVWDYFTTPSNWSKWYGGGLKEVVPGWQNGAKLVWALGGESPIDKIITGQEISILGAWMDTTYTFRANGSTRTIVKVIESDPKGGASFSDGGAANKAKRETALRKLKGCIEAETSTSKENDSSAKKKWWEFWK